jgi:hypothetical protein
MNKVITMPSPVSQTVAMSQINYIRSLRKEVREPSLSAETVKALEVVHGYVKTGTDPQGWRKVDWKTHGRGAANPSRAFERRGGGGGGSAAAGGAGAAAQAAPTTAVFNHAPIRYVSKFKTAAAAGESQVEATILNTIILGKLNKFSTGNYSDIYDFLCQILDSGQTDFLKHFMLLVFEKAAAEEFYCPLYAKLLSELSAKYTILLSEMTTLYGEYLKIFEEVDESTAVDYNDFLKRTEKKKYRLGYSQFLAELIKHGTVDVDLFSKTISTIIDHLIQTAKKPDSIRIVEEYCDCIGRIVKAVHTSDAAMAPIRSDMKKHAATLEPYTKKDPAYKSLSNKARFALMDICEITRKF